MIQKICMRVSNCPKELPVKVVRRKCKLCTAPVYATSPETEEQEKRFGEIEFVCDRCAEKMPEAGTIKTAREIHAYVVLLPPNPQRN